MQINCCFFVLLCKTSVAESHRVIPLAKWCSPLLPHHIQIIGNKIWKTAQEIRITILIFCHLHVIALCVCERPDVSMTVIQEGRGRNCLWHCSVGFCWKQYCWRSTEGHFPSDVFQWFVQFWIEMIQVWIFIYRIIESRKTSNAAEIEFTLLPSWMADMLLSGFSHMHTAITWKW